MAAADIPPGHRLVNACDLRGQQLAWAACAVFRVPAMILDGVVQVKNAGGTWQPFDTDAMLRSLVLAETDVVLVPDEIAGRLDA